MNAQFYSMAHRRGQLLNIRLPIGVARRLNGQKLDADTLLLKSIDLGYCTRTSMVAYQFRCVPTLCEVSNEVYAQMMFVLVEQSIDIVGRFAGVLIAKVMEVAVLPISGSLPTQIEVRALKERSCPKVASAM